MDTIWGGRFVSETAVTSRIKQVRRALGDDGSAQRLVKTVHGRGYRYVGSVAAVAADRRRRGERRRPRSRSPTGRVSRPRRRRR